MPRNVAHSTIAANEDACHYVFLAIAIAEGKRSMKPHKCLYCGKHFVSRRIDAQTCSNACRIKLHRRNKSLQSYTLHGLPPGALHDLNEIRKVSETAYNSLYTFLEVHGAAITTMAISAVYSGMEDCIRQLER